MTDRFGISMSLALGASLVLAAAASAQMSPHPAHIHVGSCPEVGDVVADLGDVSFDMNVDGVASPGMEAVGQASAIPVEASVTTVPLALDDIVASEHAINVHASAEDLGTDIACGDIGGTMIGSIDLPVGLAGLDDSGASGVAVLHDNGDGTTTVSVFTVPPASAMSAHPAAATNEVVSIEDFAFEPVSLDIAIGTTVTWTNEDGTPHTVTAGDGTFDSGALAQGESFSHVFDTAGTFDYLCAFHRNMSATISVG